MQARNVFREALIGYLEAGATITSAYLLAALVLRVFLSGSGRPNSDSEVARVREYVDALQGQTAAKEMNLVLEPDPKKGGLTRIPRPDCMERHLPKSRTPTEEEIREAWRQCGGE